MDDYFLEGIDNILTYHYLITEYLSSSGVDPEIFLKSNKSSQAEVIWTYLFVSNTPMSEACKGVATILNFFQINWANLSYSELVSQYNDLKLTHEEIFSKLNIYQVAIICDPTDDEWKLFEKDDWDRNLYKSTLRLDNLLFDQSKRYQCFNNYGITNSDSIDDSIQEGEFFLKLLDRLWDQSEFVYAAISLSEPQLIFLKNMPIFYHYTLSWLAKKKIPLALMYGVKRQVNPKLGLGGDGFGLSGLEPLEDMLRKTDNLFLLTTLDSLLAQQTSILAKKSQILISLDFGGLAIIHIVLMQL